MQLHMRFDDELLKQYFQKGYELFFEIYFENEGKFYPSEHWADFGEVILNWWQYAIKHYYENNECVELLFMDGYYCLEFDNNFQSVIGTSCIEELTELVQIALNKVNQKKQELGLIK